MYSRDVPWSLGDPSFPALLPSLDHLQNLLDHVVLLLPVDQWHQAVPEDLEALEVQDPPSIVIIIIIVIRQSVDQSTTLTGWSKNGNTLHFSRYLKKLQKIITRFFAYVKASVY